MSDLSERVRQAAQIIADQAAKNAGWSARIPPSLKIRASETGATISTAAPPAYPNEFGVKHPVFGGLGTRRPRAPWVRNKHRPFLGPAADQAGDKAAEQFALVIDDWAIKAGYK